MGEYEPDDSRVVTQLPGHEPGGIERTGPREDKARAEALARKAEEERRKQAEKAREERDRKPAAAGDTEHR